MTQSVVVGYCNRYACWPAAEIWRQGMSGVTLALADELFSKTGILIDPKIGEAFRSAAKMGSRVASNCPPMTLREREALDAVQIGFLIPPLPNIFLASATRVLTRALLKIFINHLLSTIHHDDLTEIPKADSWGLEGNDDGFIDLDAWNPRQTRQDVYKVIALPVSGDPDTLNPISTQWAVLGGGSWPPRVKSIQLPSREIFEVRGPHLLLVIHWRVKVRVSNRKTKTEETSNNILIPADLKVIDLIKAFKVGRIINGFFEVSDSLREIQTTDARTATELGWKHGTELRLEML